MLTNRAEQEYKVLIMPTLKTKTRGKQRWQATLLGFPYIVEEAFSRDQALHQIKARIVDMLSHSEIVTLHAPALPIQTNGDHDELIAQGWDDHGLFQNDQEALQIFDEIERQRDTQLVGGQ